MFSDKFSKINSTISQFYKEYFRYDLVTDFQSLHQQANGLRLVCNVDLICPTPEFSHTDSMGKGFRSDSYLCRLENYGKILLEFSNQSNEVIQLNICPKVYYTIPCKWSVALAKLWSCSEAATLQS